MSKYPIVECDNHPAEPGYIVCRHVVDGATVSIDFAPTPEQAGDILCDIPPWDHDIDDLMTYCATCAKEQFLSRRQ